MMRKWEFIHHYLNELDRITKLSETYGEMIILKEISKEFDDFLNRKYKRKTTSLWEVSYLYYYEMMEGLLEAIERHDSETYTRAIYKFLSLIYNIANNAEYCVACIKHIHFLCLFCKFKRKFGKCSSQSSMFNRFLKLLKRMMENLENWERK